MRNLDEILAEANLALAESRERDEKDVAAKVQAKLLEGIPSFTAYIESLSKGLGIIERISSDLALTAEDDEESRDNRSLAVIVGARQPAYTAVRGQLTRSGIIPEELNGKRNKKQEVGAEEFARAVLSHKDSYQAI